MLTKNQTSFLRSLHDKKGRNKATAFIAEGKKLVNEVLNSSLNCKEIYASRGWLEKNEERLRDVTAVFEVSESEMNKLSALSAPQEVLAVVSIPVYTIEPEVLKKSLSLVLDDISDPGNMGTIIRLADWFGI